MLVRPKGAIDADLRRLEAKYQDFIISAPTYEMGVEDIQSGRYTYEELEMCGLRTIYARQLYKHRNNKGEQSPMRCTICEYDRCRCGGRTTTIDNRLAALQRGKEAQEREISFFNSLPDEPELFDDGTPAILILEYDLDLDDATSKRMSLPLRVVNLAMSRIRDGRQWWVIFDKSFRIIAEGTWETVVTEAFYKPKYRTTWWVVTDFDQIFEHPPVEEMEIT